MKPRAKTSGAPKPLPLKGPIKPFKDPIIDTKERPGGPDKKPVIA